MPQGSFGAQERGADIDYSAAGCAWPGMSTLLLRRFTHFPQHGGKRWSVTLGLWLGLILLGSSTSKTSSFAAGTFFMSTLLALARTIGPVF